MNTKNAKLSQFYSSVRALHYRDQTSQQFLKEVTTLPKRDYCINSIFMQH